MVPPNTGYKKECSFSIISSLPYPWSCRVRRSGSKQKMRALRIGQSNQQQIRSIMQLMRIWTWSPWSNGSCTPTARPDDVHLSASKTSNKSLMKEIAGCTSRPVRKLSRCRKLHGMRQPDSAKLACDVNPISIVTYARLIAACTSPQSASIL